MKLLLKPYFVLFVVMYLLVRLFRYFEIETPVFINSHLTDFLFIPILLTVSLVGVKIIKKDYAIVLTKSMIFISFVIVSVMFEFVMPSKSNLFIQDYLDIIAYGLGALFFYWVQKRKDSFVIESSD